MELGTRQRAASSLNCDQLPDREHEMFIEWVSQLECSEPMYGG